MPSLGIVKELVLRTCAITAVFSAVSYYVVWKNMEAPSHLERSIPPLFVLYGGVIMISILYSLKKYNLMKPR